MIMRSWKGSTKKIDAEEYFDYLNKTGIRACEETDGNQGVYVVRKDEGDKTEFLFLSFWDSIESIRSFAGPEPEKAVFYPEDEKYLIDFDEKVMNYDVLHFPNHK